MEAAQLSEVNAETAQGLTEDARDAAQGYADLVAARWATWDALTAGTYMVPDPAHPGLYIATAGTSMTEDPAHDGLYLIGA